MKRALQIVQEYSRAQGWSDSEVVVMLCDLIDSDAATIERLQEFLREKMAVENADTTPILDEAVKAIANLRKDALLAAAKEAQALNSPLRWFFLVRHPLWREVFAAEDVGDALQLAGIGYGEGVPFQIATVEAINANAARELASTATWRDFDTDEEVSD